MAELVCSAPSLHLLSPLFYLTELYLAQHVQPVLTISHSQVDEVVPAFSCAHCTRIQTGRTDVVITPCWTDAEVADKYCCKFPLRD